MLTKNIFCISVHHLGHIVFPEDQLFKNMNEFNQIHAHHSRIRLNLLKYFILNSKILKTKFFINCYASS